MYVIKCLGNPAASIVLIAKEKLNNIVVYNTRFDIVNNDIPDTNLSDFN